MEKMRVRAGIWNEGEKSQEVYLVNYDEGFVLSYTPRWRTVKGAKRWAEKNGFEFVEA